MQVVEGIGDLHGIHDQRGAPLRQGKDRVPGSFYIGFGSADTMQPASANTALIDATNALAKGEAEIHDGADHGFGVYGPAYHEAAAPRSCERAKVMFDRELTG